MTHEPPSNLLHVLRRIRRCENETAAQVVLEHLIREVERSALERAADHIDRGFSGNAYADSIRIHLIEKDHGGETTD